MKTYDFVYLMPDGSVEVQNSKEMNSEVARKAHTVMVNIPEDEDKPAFSEIIKLRHGPASIIYTG